MNLKQILIDNLQNKTIESRRIFHGRGNFHEDFNYLTIDSFDELLFAILFEYNKQENEVIYILKEICKMFNYNSLIVQKRYLSNVSNQILIGENKKSYIVNENGLSYYINFLNKNIGFFLDMKNSRHYISQICEDKNVLNLFSYTCSFSVAAIKNNARNVVNIDMSKGSLEIGKKNHFLNNLNIDNVKFFSYDILKSWNKIKKYGPYDIIIIDPPSFQKGSFTAGKDYEKIIKRINTFSSKNCTVLACLNAPELDSNFIKNKFKEFCVEFKFEQRIANPKEFLSLDEEKSLKTLIFKNF